MCEKKTPMSRHHQQGGEPSQRMLRVGEVIRHALSDLLSRGAIADPALEGKVVTVPDVKMSPDLKLATVAQFGGWSKAQPAFFGDGGIFDQVYSKGL